MDKSADAYRTISEAAGELDLPQHVLRFWETRFAQIQPMKRGGGRRFYRPDDMELLRAIRHFLYDQGYTIKGVQRLLKERGARAVVALRNAPPDVEPPAQRIDHPGEMPRDRNSPGAPTGGVAAAAENRQIRSNDLLDGLRSALAELAEARRILAAANPTG